MLTYIKHSSRPLAERLQSQFAINLNNSWFGNYPAIYNLQVNSEVKMRGIVSFEVDRTDDEKFFATLQTIPFVEAVDSIHAPTS